MTGYLGMKDDEDLLREENARLRAENIEWQDRCLAMEIALGEARAEVKRLDGLILDWWDNYDNYAPSAALEAEAKRIRGERQ